MKYSSSAGSGVTTWSCIYPSNTSLTSRSYISYSFKMFIATSRKSSCVIHPPSFLSAIPNVMLKSEIEQREVKVWMKKSEKRQSTNKQSGVKFVYLGRQGFYHSRRTTRDEISHSSHGKFYTGCERSSRDSLQICSLAPVVLPLPSPVDCTSNEKSNQFAVIIGWKGSIYWQFWFYKRKIFLQRTWDYAEMNCVRLLIEYI